MYKTKRFSQSTELLSDDEVLSLPDGINSKSMRLSPIRMSNKAQYFFGGLTSNSYQDKSYMATGGTVRSSLRLQSYIHKFNVDELKRVIGSYSVSLKNGETYRSSDLITVNGPEGKETWQFNVINADYNPILVTYLHPSYDSLMDTIFKVTGFSDDSDYYTYLFDRENGESLRVIYFTIDSYESIVNFISTLSVIFKLSGQLVKCNIKV